MGIVLEWNVIIAFCTGLMILGVLLKVMSAPFKMMWRFFLNVVFGGLALWIFNLMGGLFGFTLNINIITAFIVGFLGMPGVVLLVVLKFILGV